MHAVVGSLEEPQSPEDKNMVRVLTHGRGSSLLLLSASLTEAITVREGEALY